MVCSCLHGGVLGFRSIVNTTASNTSRSEDKNEEDRERITPLFPQFQFLNDDLQLVILSFVSEDPFGKSSMRSCDSPSGTLTHVLPLVSHKYHKLSYQSDILWMDALHRGLVSDEGNVWESGLRSLLARTRNNENQDSGNTDSTEQSSDDSRCVSSSSSLESDLFVVPSPSSTTHNGTQQQLFSQRQDLIHKSCIAIRIPQQSDDDEETLTPSPSLNRTPLPSAAQLVYRYIVSHHLRFKGPVFHMPGQVTLGKKIGLHFFERRYRYLIGQVMDGQPREHLMGEPFTSNFPRFIYANHTSLARGSPACIVQILQCHMFMNGTADVMLLPTEHVWIEQIRLKPCTGGLCEATVRPMGREDSDAVDGIIMGFEGW
eukprot:CAMPEP_0195538660 /NCGR_PEP_ID=MMETSP0794_2-20130614/49652_1 /TAXON_ID=515487 /ORGANISM="Stephanopyxis turris, Strain CCMP 815" /LENGTH=372 /DNA_ID=CAMNT_0040672667 /DNA_START=558 /DNA_END=1673 /DNA_ORIENTATION=-